MVRFLMDQLADPGLTAKRMFGGHGIYSGGRMFALVYDGQVYIKVSDDEAARSERPVFSPQSGKTFPTFREVSADELEDAEALASLAARAQAAIEASGGRRGSRKRI